MLYDADKSKNRKCFGQCMLNIGGTLCEQWKVGLFNNNVQFV